MAVGRQLKFFTYREEVWLALSQREEQFSGEIGVTLSEGNRRLRYEFYILCNPTFPGGVGVNYFFVHHPRQIYEQQYLGREREVMNREAGRVRVGSLVIVEGNPITGIVDAGNTRLRQVSFEDVLELVEELRTEYPTVDTQLFDYSAEELRQGELRQEELRQKYRRSEVFGPAFRALTDFECAVEKAAGERFAGHNLVHNSPGTCWRGKPVFDGESREADPSPISCSLFIYG